MHNTTCYPQTPLSLSFLSTSFCHGKDLCGVLMSNFYHVSTSLSFFLLFLHVSSIFFIKLFTFIHNNAIFKGDVEIDSTSINECMFETTTIITDECYEKEDLIADVFGGETLLFLYKESSKNDAHLVEEVEDSKKVVFLEEEESIIASEFSTYYYPQEDIAHDEKLVTEYNDAPKDSEDFNLDENEAIEEENVPNAEENKDSSEDERLLISIKDLDPRYKKFQLEGVPENGENYGGSLTGDSTSKSSVEWRSSTIFRDSETEYPFSSSSRRSSSRWESYTVFSKYNEGMVFLDRISAQKLSETESLRSTKVHPRSISERIVHKLSTKPKNYTLGRRDPYEELESAYVAQICLAWEALSWNYINFKQKITKNEEEGCGSCPARIAKEFQQFQVLLQRFIENEPYEFGRRPEVYARRRISSPKLLQVPEFRDSEADEVKEDLNLKISYSDFQVTLDDAIQTFMNFLKVDKEKCGDKIKAFIKRKSTPGDVAFLQFLKKANRRLLLHDVASWLRRGVADGGLLFYNVNPVISDCLHIRHNKKWKLKDIGRRHRCIKKRKLTEREEMEIFMGLIDLKVVSRVLRMTNISNEQLHWCEEKMSRVRVWDGKKMQRDSSPLFFPVH